MAERVALVEVGSTQVAAEHVSVKRVALRLRDEELATNRLRGIGFAAVSTGGWQGPVRAIRQDAVADMYVYRASLPDAAPRGEAVSPDERAEAS